MKKEYQNRSGEYEKSYGGSSYNKDERSHYTISKEETAPPKARKVEPKPLEDAGNVSEEPLSQLDQKKKRMKTVFMKLFWLWLFLTILSNVFTWIKNDDSWDEALQSEENMDDPWGWVDEDLEEDAQTVPDNSEANNAASDGANDATNAASKAVSDSLESESAEIAPKENDEPVSD